MSRTYFLIFRYGECPSGLFQYSKIIERNLSRAWAVALARYGNYAPYSILTQNKFDKSIVKALGATLFETIKKKSKERYIILKGEEDEHDKNTA